MGAPMLVDFLFAFVLFGLNTAATWWLRGWWERNR